MSQWGVYGITALDAERRAVDFDSKSAEVWVVRWRVDGRGRKRLFKTKGYARTFRDQLLRAQVMEWGADTRGRPIDPRHVSSEVEASTGSRRSPSNLVPASTARVSMSVRTYCETVWWPIVGPTLDDKNRLGHRGNMRLAMTLLTYQAGDPRVGVHAGAEVGASILLSDLLPDDLRRAVVERRSSNLRTRAVNLRRIDASFEAAGPGGPREVEVNPERASVATVRAFFVTMQMIVRAAMRSGHTHGDPLAGVNALAPAPRAASMVSRVVPSIDEVMDLADAIADLGPRRGAHRSGDRLRSLIMVAGTLGARPGELVAHRPEWITWSDPTTLRFEQTEASFYDRETGQGGSRTRPLKHRETGEFRQVPAIDAVRDALSTHIERGYTGHGRTWTSPSGRGRLNWGNLTETYWRPACERVFGGTEKRELVTMPPKTLRKAAITFWLDAGINPFLAAEWAGHSEDVAKRYYAGRAAASFASEVARLGQHWQRD
ncbi:hypothetical protein ABFT23_02130 [Nocardioides sp. C4-1]|uniref:hypothetical protein n=1 Tax=Nocardioides sp. C4-1 TaxID=3151851 RepID=UPI0032659024